MGCCCCRVQDLPYQPLLGAFMTHILQRNWMRFKDLAGDKGSKHDNSDEHVARLRRQMGVVVRDTGARDGGREEKVTGPFHPSGKVHDWDNAIQRQVHKRKFLLTKSNRWRGRKSSNATSEGSLPDQFMPFTQLVHPTCSSVQEQFECQISREADISPGHISLLSPPWASGPSTVLFIFHTAMGAMSHSLSYLFYFNNDKKFAQISEHILQTWRNLYAS